MASRGLPVRGSLLTLLCGLGAATAWAQTPSFNPSVGVGLGYTDNVEFVGDGSRADTVGILDADLPWVRTTRNGSLRLHYRPLLLRYREFENLDRLEHRFDAGLSSRLRESTLGFSALVHLTQQQGNAFSLEDEDLFLNQRADREVYRARLSYDRPLSDRWLMTALLGGAILNYESIDGQGDTRTNEDRTEAIVNVQVSRSLSHTSRLGLEYGYRHFELDVSGAEDVNLLSVNYEREFSRRTSLEFGLGGFSSTGETIESRQDYTMTCSLRHARRVVNLDVEASHQPSSGGGGRGSSTNSVLGLIVQTREPDVWYWQASLRFAHRDPTGTDDRRLSFTLGFSVDRRMSDSISLRLDGRYVDQIIDEAARTNQSVLGASIGLVWYPRGTARSGRR